MEIENSHLLDQVKELYDKNHHKGSANGQEYDYTCPSPKSYPHQWLWDSSFHAIVLSIFDTDRAKGEIKTLLSKQRADGFVSCVSIWEKKHPFEEMLFITKITQPPVIPISVETIYEKTKDKDFVGLVYPKLKGFMDWLAIHRDRNANGLLEIKHPWEDGDDGNPSFDKQMRFKLKPSTVEYFYSIFRVLGHYSLLGWDENKIHDSKVFSAETALFNSIYAKSLLSMIKLAEVMGDGEGVVVFGDKYRKTRDALLGLCWNENDGIFYDLDESGKQTGIKTTSSLMPLILPDLPNEVVKPLVENHLLNEKEFWTPYPVASVARDEKTFDPNNGYRLWRGPMWVNTNWFLSGALNHYGYTDEARQIVSRTGEAIAKYGFREFYNPFTGEGYGQPNFGWSSLVLDMATR